MATYHYTVKTITAKTSDASSNGTVKIRLYGLDANNKKTHSQLKQLNNTHDNFEAGKTDTFDVSFYDVVHISDIHLKVFGDAWCPVGVIIYRKGDPEDAVYFINKNYKLIDDETIKLDRQLEMKWKESNLHPTPLKSLTDDPGPTNPLVVFNKTHGAKGEEPFSVIEVTAEYKPVLGGTATPAIPFKVEQSFSSGTSHSKSEIERASVALGISNGFVSVVAEISKETKHETSEVKKHTSKRTFSIEAKEHPIHVIWWQKVYKYSVIGYGFKKKTVSNFDVESPTTVMTKYPHSD